MNVDLKKEEIEILLKIFDQVRCNLNEAQTFLDIKKKFEEANKDGDKTGTKTHAP